jgi:hypothetical protein
MSNGAQYRPTTIYVTDFDLESDSVKSEGLLSRSRLHVLREQSQAQSLVDEMSKAIVSDLAKKGLQAQRLPTAAPLPQQGWLVRGAFLQVDAGNRLRRAVIGFGQGQTDLQVAVAIDNLATGKAPAPLYQMETEAQSGKSPGAVVTLNPYAAAAKFVLAGQDLSRNTKSTASKIADEVAARVKSAS